ncbi:Glycosyltransferase family 92 protein RCOM_0530710 [Linum grandiflorum]
MDSDHQRRKRKRLNRAANEFSLLISFRSLTLCISFFLFIFLHFSFSDRSPFRPIILRVLTPTRVRPNRLTLSDPPPVLPPLIESRILLPDHLLLILSTKLRRGETLDCLYHHSDDDDDGQMLVRPAISAEDYQESKSIVRCELPPPGNYSSAVDLRRPGEMNRLLKPASRTAPPSYYDGGMLVYEAILDWNSVVVLAKGLNLKPRKESDPSEFRCHFGLTDFNQSFVFTTEATAAAQEVVRCLLPRSIRINNNTELAEGITVTISHVSESNSATLMPSVAKVYNPKSSDIQFGIKKKKYEICACTMMWNQAAFLKEWVTYHAWLGVQRWFIYDNDSNDGIQNVVDELESYNVTRHVWPWPKSQEAGFSHCALRAKYECNWVGFFDVDEFFYFPRYSDSYTAPPGRNSLRALMSNYTDSKIAEVRTTCRSFGPSGLTRVPQQGVTVGYTCRLQAPERHKSFVRPDLLDSTVLNIIHHFKLKEGYESVNVGETTAVINHYKYQVWDTFKAKFFRRVSTYVANWQDDHNKGSKDRAPGLGTEAVEPEDWRLRFCEVWDTGLKDFVLDTFADVATGFLPWEKSSGI